jgi:cbb3-type cytochrome oxidase maturation protein
MSVIYIVFPLALVIAAVAVVAFIWAARSGQFDDLSTPAMRVLHDDEPGPKDAVPEDPDEHGPGTEGPG